MACLAFAAMGQEFEVASVKPNQSQSNSESDGTDHGRFTATNIDLRSLIARAHGMRNYQISGPDWLDSARFDIAAKFPEGFGRDNYATRQANYRAMLRNLLAQRFKLETHRDSKPFSVYGLVAGKNGIKFKEVPDSDNHNRNTENYSFTGTCISMESFAEFLSWHSDLPVLDMTGLKGYYDLKLHWVPEERRPASSDKAAAEAPSGPTLAIAIEEQLGLKLERRKAPIEILVIDHVDPVPTEN
jgi:uncharacterized protein (TIGR03435 family)